MLFISVNSPRISCPTVFFVISRRSGVVLSPTSLLPSIQIDFCTDASGDRENDAWLMEGDRGTNALRASSVWSISDACLLLLDEVPIWFILNVCAVDKQALLPFRVAGCSISLEHGLNELVASKFDCSKKSSRPKLF